MPPETYDDVLEQSACYDDLLEAESYLDAGLVRPEPTTDDEEEAG